MIDELWGDEPPASAVNLVQGAVSHLRKILGREAIATRGAGYALSVEPDALDLQRFERLAEAGSIALADGHLETAAATLGEALALWRGPALADLRDERFLHRWRPARGAAAARGRTAARGRARARAPRGRARGHARARRRAPAARARPRAADARRSTAAGARPRRSRPIARRATTLVEELGISPGPALQELEARILRQDPDLMPAAAAEGRTPPPTVAAPEPCADPRGSAGARRGDALVALAEPLARQPERELLLVGTVAQGDRLASLSAGLRRSARACRPRRERARRCVHLGRARGRRRPHGDRARRGPDARGRAGGPARGRPPAHVARTAPVRRGRGGRSRRVRRRAGARALRGASHDWAAIELGAWLARNAAHPVARGARTEGAEGRDASRCWRAPRWPFSTPSACPRSRCWWSRARGARGSRGGRRRGGGRASPSAGAGRGWAHAQRARHPAPGADRAGAPGHAARWAGAANGGHALHLDLARAPERPASSERQANVQRAGSRTRTPQPPGGRNARPRSREQDVARDLRRCAGAGRARRGRDLPALRQADHGRPGGGRLQDARRPDRQLEDHAFEELGTEPYYHARGTEDVPGLPRPPPRRFLQGDPSGTLNFEFEYWGLFGSADPASLVWGACFHPVTSGTGDFAGAQGVIQMVDTPTGNGVKTRYIGNLKLGAAAERARAAAASRPSC